MTFGRWGKVRSLAPPYLFGLAAARAGLPVFFIAPRSGGKTTVIKAVEDYLKERGEAVDFISRMGLRGLRKKAKWLNKVQEATLVNDDFSLIWGSARADDYMLGKMMELITSLSYDGRYADDGLDVRVEMRRLGFLSGVQPYWLKAMMSHRTFHTHIGQKCIRYYMLPYTASKDVDEREARLLLVERTEEREDSPSFRIPKSFLEALMRQCGPTRGRMYAEKLAKELARLIGPRYIHQALKFYAVRLAFEDEIVSRWLTDTGYQVDVRWREYTALYWALRYRPCPYWLLRLMLGVSGSHPASTRTVAEITEAGVSVGWIAKQYNSGQLYIVANPRIIKRVAWEGR